MATPDYLTYSQIRSKVMRAIRDYNESMIDLVKDAINMVYLNEVMVADELRPLYWMIDFDDSLASVAPATITGITKANPGVFTTSAAHGLKVGDIITIHSVVGMTELNNKVYQISTVPSTTTFTVGVNTGSYTTYSSAGTVNHRGVTLQTNNKTVQRVIKAGWHDEQPMKMIGPEEIEDNNAYHWTDDTAGPPQRCYYGKTYGSTGNELDQLIWHPGASSSYTLRYWFEKRPQALTNDNDVPLLPYQFHNMIVAGTIARLSEYNVSVDNPAIWTGLYTRQLDALKAFNQDHWQKIEKEENRRPYLL